MPELVTFSDKIRIIKYKLKPNDMERKNWVVRCYDKKDKLIQTFKIEDRTEHEAENEATALMPRETEDWTMMPEEKK